MDGEGSERFDTVVVGAGQAGLSAGYHLKRAGRSFVILDANDRIGGSWRTRYDSLRLFTPSWAVNLPGWRFPRKSAPYPSREQMADYLEAYADGSTCPCARASTCSGSREWETGTSCPSPTVGSRPTT